MKKKIPECSTKNVNGTKKHEAFFSMFVSWASLNIYEKNSSVSLKAPPRLNKSV